MSTTTPWAVNCKNDTAGIWLRFESVNLNGDGHFDRQEFDSTSNARLVYLPATTCTFVVEAKGLTGWETIWKNIVNNGNQLDVQGAWPAKPKVTLDTGTGNTAQAATS